MIIDLTTNIQTTDGSLLAWVRDAVTDKVKAGHIGTHLDTVNKTTIPLEYFKSRGVLFDVRGKQEVTETDIALHHVQADDFVLFRTGRIEETPYGREEYFRDNPQLSHSLIAALLEKKIRFIGVDCSGIRQKEEHRVADALCEEHGTYVIENLCNLGKIPDTPFTIYTMWLDDSEVTGLRCRVLVETTATL